MAEHYGFFDALETADGQFDRTYSARDYNENLATIISNGVLRSENDDLKVKVSGLSATVGAGRAWINGCWYKNDSNLTFGEVTAPTGGARYDRVVLRYSNLLADRNIKLMYLEGEASSNPSKPVITRNDDVFDLVLADIYIQSGAVSATVTDTRGDTDVCGWVYSVSGDGSFFRSLDNSFMSWFEDKKDTLSSVTLFKRYTDTQTITAQTSQIAFNIPQYDANTCFIEVYVNGILDQRYTLNNNVITFSGSLVAGTVVTVNCYKSIDGTGIMSVAEEITELQNQMAQVQGNAKYVYECTGLDDNISISQIAHAITRNKYDKNNVTESAAAFLEGIGATRQSGTTYTLNFDKEAQIGIDIIGKCGVTTAYSGTGTSAKPYKWFELVDDTFAGRKRIIFDFAKCDKITISCAANTYNYLFYGTDLTIKNIKCFATSAGANCKIYAVMGPVGNKIINVDNCRFTLSATGTVRIAEHGTFTNCYGYIKSETSNAYCFNPESISDLIRVIGGEYYAYTRDTTDRISAIFYTGQGETDGACIAQNINCPTISLTGYKQSNLSIANAGNTVIQGVVTTLTSSGSHSRITGQIDMNKA